MTPDNRAGQDLIKGDVTPAILFDRVGDDRPIGRGSSSASFLGMAMHPRCGNHGTSDPDSPCRPNLIARPRSTLLHIRLLPAFPRTIIWILRAPLEHQGFPLMIKRLCVTTAPAWAIGSTRENCVHSIETDFALHSADASFNDALSTSILRVQSLQNRDSMTAWSIDSKFLKLNKFSAN